MRFLRVEVQMKNTNNLNKSRLMRLIIAGVIVAITLLTLIMSIGESNVNASAAVNTSTGVTADIGADNVVTGGEYVDSTSSNKRFYVRNLFPSGKITSVNIPYVKYQVDGVPDRSKIYTNTFSCFTGAAVGDTSLNTNALSLQAAGGTLFINIPSSDVSTTIGLAPLYFTFNISESLKNVLRDGLVTVSVRPYVHIGTTNDLSDKTGHDSVKFGFAYYNQGSVFASETQARPLTLREGKLIFPSNSTRLNPGEYSSDAFFQVTLTDWKGVDDYLAVRIKEVGIEIEITPNSSVIINDNLSKMTISGTNRHPDASTEYANSGDIVNFDLVIQDGGTDLTLDKGAYGTTTTYTAGTAYREYFLGSDKQGEGQEDEYIIDWKINSGYASIVDNGDKSGQNISFKVISGESSTGELEITASYCYRNGLKKVSQATKTFLIYVDNSLPNRPEFDKNTFYEKYFRDYIFYTEGEGQEISPITNKPISLNLIYGGSAATSDTIPYLSKDSVNIKGGSPTVVYYKTTYVGDEVPDISAEKVSTGFEIKNANEPDTNTEDGTTMGVFCTILEGNYEEYAEGLFIELFNSTGTNVISGVWSIELVACDYVGNSMICPTKYFIRIDVTDYVFTIKYLLGEGEESSTINNNAVEISYATINDSGKKSAYKVLNQDEIELRREWY